MAIKYIPYTTEPLRGQAVLPFLRYHSQLTAKDFVVKGLPYYETELVEKVNGGGDNLVIHGDCLNACAYLKEKNSKVDLVYIDPPFASGANYAKKIYIRKNPKLVARLEAAEEEIKKQRADEGAELDNADLQAIEETMYGDIWQKEDYLNWMYERLLAIKEVMSNTASIYVHLDYNIGHYVKILMDEIFGEENFIGEFIWLFSGREMNERQWNPKHNNIYCYGKTKNWIFNFEDVAEEPSKEVLAQYKNVDENGKRYVIRSGQSKGLSKEGPNTYRQYYKPVPPRDYKYFSYISSSDEHLGYATQKPEDLIEHFIKASSNKKMLVADFFGGSGVAAVVAHKLGRKFITADVGLNSIQTMRDRLDEAGAKFDILKIKDGIDLFRNPQQSMEKLATVIPGLSTRHDYGKFWFGAITEDGMICPCWVPNLLDKSQAILNAALFTKILDEAAKLETVSKIVICSVDKKDDKEIDKMISEYDLRDNEGKKIEFVFKDLKELTDLLVYPDIVKYSIHENGGIYKIVIDRLVSDNLMRKINEYNAKKQSKEETAKTKIEISDDGLELIEYISIDCTNKTDAWNSDQEIKIDKRGYVIKNGEKTKEFWDGKIVADKNPLRLKVRNIAGDETIINLLDK